MLVAGMFEFPADVRETGDGGDVQILMAMNERLVGTQSVTLEVAVKGGLSLLADEDVIQTGVGTALVPVK